MNTLDLITYKGIEKRAISKAIFKVHSDENYIGIRVETGEAIVKLSYTDDLNAKPNFEVRLDEFKLEKGFKLTIPNSGDDLSNFYYVEHTDINNIQIEVKEVIDENHIIINFYGEIQDPNSYLITTPKAQIKFEIEFVRDDNFISNWGIV